MKDEYEWCANCDEDVRPLIEDSEWEDHACYLICPNCDHTVRKIYAYRHERDEDTGADGA